MLRCELVLGDPVVQCQEVHLDKGVVVVVVQKFAPRVLDSGRVVEAAQRCGVVIHCGSHRSDDHLIGIYQAEAA